MSLVAGSGMARRDLIAPLCQFEGGGCLEGVVGSQVAVDDLGELALEAAQGFGGGLMLGLLALVVGAAGAGVHGLDAGGQVQGVVEGSVAGAGESVAALIAAGDLDRGGAGVAGVVVGVGEAGDVTGVAEDLG